MRPELFKVLDIGFPAYFVLLLTGFSFATAVAVIWARRIGQNPDVIVDLALAALLMGVIGGRIFHVLFDGFFMDYVHLCTDPTQVQWTEVKELCGVGRYQGGVWNDALGYCHPEKPDCFAWARFWAGGLTYYGGLAFSSVTGILLLRRDRFPVLKACDLSAVGIAIGLGFGRMGCLLAGCCFGQPYDGALALVFPPGSPASEAQAKLDLLPTKMIESNPVYPTQAMESLMSFAVAGFLLLYLQGRKKYDGQVFIWFLALYALGRFVIEFFRADDRGGVAGLSTSQIIGLVIIGLCVALHRAITTGALEKWRAAGG
ncbi:MAG TPA: prolipoprotein diacylglyceryl transferase [Polyangiaceae bacterium]|nr:prolipoprotein diacylglyceryl transferase [Polyangiaceae bacterium]